MRVNRILMDRLLAQWDLLRMKAAYILAEHQLEDESELLEERDPDGEWTFSTTMTPEQFNNFEVNAFGNPRPLRPKDDREKLHDKLMSLKKQITLALEEEDYSQAAVLRDIINVARIKWNKMNNQ